MYNIKKRPTLKLRLEVEPTPKKRKSESEVESASKKRKIEPKLKKEKKKKKIKEDSSEDEIVEVKKTTDIIDRFLSNKRPRERPDVGKPTKKISSSIRPPKRRAAIENKFIISPSKDIETSSKSKSELSDSDYHPSNINDEDEKEEEALLSLGRSESSSSILRSSLRRLSKTASVIDLTDEIMSSQAPQIEALKQKADDAKPIEITLIAMQVDDEYTTLNEDKLKIHSKGFKFRETHLDKDIISKILICLHVLPSITLYFISEVDVGGKLTKGPVLFLLHQKSMKYLDDLKTILYPENLKIVNSKELENEVILDKKLKQFKTRDKEVILSYPPDSKNKTEITTSDMERLNDGEYLNDAIINFWIQYLQTTNKIDSRRCYVCNTFFYTLNIEKRNNSNLRSWTKKINLFDYEFIFIPINVTFHWKLAIVCNSGKVDNDKQPCLLVLDSLNYNSGTVARNIRFFLTNEWKAKYQTERIFKSQDLPFHNPKVPKQTNATDCGVFVLEYIEKFCELLPDIRREENNKQIFCKLDEMMGHDWFSPNHIVNKRLIIKKTILSLVNKEPIDDKKDISLIEGTNLTDSTENIEKSDIKTDNVLTQNILQNNTQDNSNENQEKVERLPNLVLRYDTLEDISELTELKPHRLDYSSVLERNKKDTDNQSSSEDGIPMKEWGSQISI